MNLHDFILTPLFEEAYLDEFLKQLPSEDSYYRSLRNKVESIAKSLTDDKFVLEELVMAVHMMERTVAQESYLHGLSDGMVLSGDTVLRKANIQREADRKREDDESIWDKLMDSSPRSPLARLLYERNRMRRYSR